MTTESTITAPAIDQPAAPTARDEEDRLYGLRATVERRKGKSHRLTQELTAAIERWKEPAVVHRALAKFDALRESERLALMSGWPRARRRYTRPEMLEEFRNSGFVLRALKLDASKDGSVVGSVDEFMADNYTAVQVHILEGTSKAEALEMLAKIIGKLAAEWVELLTHQNW